MTLQDWNNDLLYTYLICFALIYILLRYTTFGEGWRHERGKRIVFTMPPRLRLLGFPLALLGPVSLLIGQTSNMVNLAVFVFLFFGVPSLLVIFGIQEFSANIEDGTYFTRRGTFGFATALLHKSYWVSVGHP